MCAVSCLRNPLVIKIINPIVFPFTLRFLIDLCLIYLHMGTISFFIWTLSSTPINWDIWHAQLVQFSSVAQSCPTLCDPMNHSTPGLPVHHQLLEFTQTHVHRVGDAIQPSHPLSSPSPPAPNSLPASGSFPVSQLFAWGGQSIGVSASASVLPMNTQDWSPLDILCVIYQVPFMPRSVFWTVLSFWLIILSIPMPVPYNLDYYASIKCISNLLSFAAFPRMYKLFFRITLSA